MRRRVISLGILLGLLLPGVIVYEAARTGQQKHPLDAHLSRRYTDDLEGLLERRYIRVLVVINKTSFFISKGQFFGFEYELLRDYQKHLNRNIDSGGLPVVLEYIPCPRDELIERLVEGRGDIAAAGLTITPGRRERVAFTRPYLKGIDEVIVTHRDVKAPETLDGLSGSEVFVRRSSSYFESLTALNMRLEREGLRPVRIVEADENLETEDILEMVNAGAVDMTVSDSHITGIWKKLLKNIEVHDELAMRRDGKIAWMVRKGNPELKESLDRFLKKRKRGTLHGNIYFNRYFENTKWITNPLGKGERERIRRYEKLFRAYGEKYGFDWKLLMAMAFQESGLDHSKRSPAGAIGLMQVRPSTARGRNVGIEDIQDTENNVHAAVKYLDFIRDRYFSEEHIRPRDQVRFALASYNAGPAKIQQVRTRAEEMGLDSNRWFRNVELAALEVIGRETVRYVSNINKYYVIYSMALDD